MPKGKCICKKDIRDKLPDTKGMKFDYDDILSRSLYHIEKSLRHGNIAKKEFSKAIFKFSYYLCVFFDPDFYFTSIIKILNKLKSIIQIVKHVKESKKFLKDAVSIRYEITLSDDIVRIREDFIVFIFRLLLKGGLHKTFNGAELNLLLVNYFGGFPLLKRFLKAHPINL